MRTIIEIGTCPDCAGSGEGMRDGSTCRRCKGGGEIGMAVEVCEPDDLLERCLLLINNAIGDKDQLVHDIERWMGAEG